LHCPLQVISGQNLPRPRGSGAKGDVVEPYVYVEIHGIPADCAERRTRTITQNEGNPIFDESFEFQINLPELAMVRFVVLDDDFIGDEFIGFARARSNIFLAERQAFRKWMGKKKCLL